MKNSIRILILGFDTQRSLQERQATHPAQDRMALYREFGEDCATHNLVPSYSLFELWASDHVKEECQNQGFKTVTIF